MNRRVARRIVVVLALCGCMAGPLAIAPNAGAVDEDRAALSADCELLQALREADKGKLDGLLDADFTWIDASGKNLTRAQALKNPPAISNSDIEAQAHTYAHAAILRANRGKMQVLRVWVKRESGWRMLLYQEVKQVEKSEPPTAGDTGAGACENPCKSIPFEPETQSERAAIASWQGVMRAKVERLAQIQKQKRTGIRSVPPALITARMFDLGETVMMIACEQRPQAKAYFNTRMWVRRDGRWQMLFSFNTRIDAEGDVRH
jgi:hypothetical protein